MKHIATVIILSTLSHATFAAEALAIPYNTEGKKGQTVQVKALHKFKITNNQTTTQNYLVMEKITVNGQETKRGWGFTLTPNATKTFEETRALTYHATTAGTYKIEATTAVSGQPSAVHTGYANLTVN